MRWMFYFIACLFLIVFQTSVLPLLPILSGLYDLLIPLLLYLCIFRTTREAIIALLFLGVVMDNLSGAPAGLYLSAYFVFYVCVIWVASFLNIANKLLIALIVAFGVVLENLFHWFAVYLSGDHAGIFFKILNTAPDQILWAICTGPFIIIGLHSLQDKWDYITSGFFAEKSAEG